MLYRKLYFIALIAIIVCTSSTINPKSSEPMMIDVEVACGDKLINELVIYTKKVIDKNSKMEEVYKLFAEAFIKKYNISFFAHKETFVFVAQIPINFKQSEVYGMIDNILIEHMPKKYSDQTFPNHIFSQSTVALAETCISALDKLIEFAKEELGNKNRCTSKIPSKECSVVYNSGSQYDANVILTINWFIELIGNSYKGAYLYNYEIGIRVEEENLVYKVVFGKGPSYLPVSEPTYDFVPAFQEYCQVLSQLDFKKLSEGETANKFLRWSQDGYKLELVECINENKGFFNNIFDVIRKFRMNEKEIYYFAHPGFLVPHHLRSTNPLFELTPEEEKLMRDLSIYPVKNTIIKPCTDLSFLYSPDELNKNVTYKDCIEREIIVALFVRNYASSYYLEKIHGYLSRDSQKYKIIMCDDNCDMRAFSRNQKDIKNFLESRTITSFCDIDKIPYDVLQFNIGICFKNFVDPFLHVEFVTRKLQEGRGDTTKDVNSKQRHQKEKILRYSITALILVEKKSYAYVILSYLES